MIIRGMDVTDTSVQSLAVRILNAWSIELARAISPLRRAGRPWSGMLVRTGSEFEVYVRQGRTMQHLGRIHPGDPDAAGKIVAQMRRKGVSNDRLVLRLEQGAVLSTQLVLPAGVGDVLGLVVRNQLERVAPWSSNQALFAFEQVPAALGDTQIRVDLWVTGKAEVDQALAELSGLGLVPGIVDAATTQEEKPRFNLIGRADETLTRLGNTIARLIKVGAVVAALACLAGVGYDYRLGVLQAAQEQLIQREMEAAIAAASPRDAEAQRQRALLLAQRSKAPSVAVALEALSRALPDDAYLERLELRNGVITLTGKARSAADLIGPLEAARYFEQVQFTAPTTRKAGEEGEEFSLSLRVKSIMTLEPGRAP